MLHGKLVVVGVAGGIAAYKAAELVSRLRKAGAETHVIMTANACNFVAPLTFQSLSAHPVHIEQFGESKLGGIEHVELARRADLMVIAPATANLMAKAAHGLADDLLTTVLLARKGPVLLAPAMNEQMYAHPATQANLRQLTEFGYRLVGPDTGFQACGTQGAGRMAEPAEIFANCCEILGENQALSGKTVLVTAGGTREALDPVRFIGNHSSGKMGYALAQAALEAGAAVVLVSGPTCLQPPDGVELVRVESALQMYQAVFEHLDQCDIIIKAAAVADFRPEDAALEKIKKTGRDMLIKLVPNPDILLELGRVKGDKLLVGFAAETQDLQANAVAKLRRKNVDMLVANNVTKPGSEFGSETNEVNLFYPDGNREDLPLLTKLEVAREIIQRMSSMLRKKEKERSHGQ
ncbi:MAG: bifunctional phosphopantothenoylcysteine decarboxylase/phosphopantothenate--cysteine ligase CoaBC [Peptococcaceae bacterium]|nr:bifunctional phosphopantothenoylcysteine decarboxylase/phosphopantothenate--cysteine ligase CoaBC [Peptococcaceae bacterium]